MVVESEAYKGKKKIPTNQLTYGFGINDADYQTQGRPTTLGYFNTPEEAHECWYAAKKKQAHILAQEQTDARVAAALIARFP